MMISQFTIRIAELDEKEWKMKIKDWKLWYKSFVRGFVDGNIVFLKKNSRFLFPHSKEDLVLHEVGHILGFRHRWFGVMAWHGLFRL